MPGIKFQGLHFLIVDDDDTFLQLIAGLVQSLGASRITLARTGSEAVAKLSTAKLVVDVILCDYKMDFGNGLQLLKAIRTGQIRTVRPDACFVMITGVGEAETIRLAAHLDINGYLVKPISQEKLEAAVAKARAKYFPVIHPLTPRSPCLCLSIERARSL